MTTAINPANAELSPEIRAGMLQEGLEALITAKESWEELYFDRRDRIWPHDNPELAIAVNGIIAKIHKDSVRVELGQAIGNLSGIFPYIEYLDHDEQLIKTHRLTVDGEGRPNFQVLPI